MRVSEALHSRKEWIPAGLAILATFGTLALLEGSVLRASGGVFMYPLDDPYIHMQIARNIVHSGTWGINPQEFGSASSSLLYTALLTVLFKIWFSSLMPFIINSVTAVVLLLVIDRWLRRQTAGVMARTWILLAVVFLTPLPSLIMTGMEHTLQCLFSFLFLTGFAAWLEKSREAGKNAQGVPWSLLVYAFLVTAIRYEGIFLVFLACLMALYYRKVMSAFLVGIAALAPILVFGVYSIAKGSYFFPNSVLVKSEGVPLSAKGIINFLNNTFVYKWTVVKTQGLPVGSPPPGISLLATQRLLLLLPLLYLALMGFFRRQRVYAYMLTVLTGCTLLHLAFAATGWFYRYEAYLILLSVVLTGAVLARRAADGWGEGRRKYVLLPALLLSFALFFPFILRSTAAFSKAKQACLNIYSQQYQMAQFLRQYYDHSTVAANDIGAISFFTDIRTVDLWGLGSIEVARSKKGGYWTPVYLDSLVRARQVKLAIVFDEWFDPALLHRWSKVATWQISDNVICGSDIVSFYAVRQEDAESIRADLRAFSQRLPDVKVVYY